MDTTRIEITISYIDTNGLLVDSALCMQMDDEDLNQMAFGHLKEWLQAVQNNPDGNFNAEDCSLVFNICHEDHSDRTG